MIIFSRYDLRFLLYSAVIIVLWSTPPLISKLWVGTTQEFPGLYFGFLRYFVGAITLFIILSFRKKTHQSLWRLFKQSKFHIFLSSLWLSLMIFGQNFSVLFILGSSSSILLNFNPSIIYLLAPLIFQDEYYSKKRSLGFLLSSTGVIIVFIASIDIINSNLVAFIIGNSLGFLSGVAWAGYSLTIKYFFQQKDELSSEITSLNLFASAVTLILVSLIFETPPSPESYSIESIWGILVIGVGAAAIAFTLYLRLIQEYGATEAGNIQFLIPIMSLILAWVFLKEFSFFAIIGGIICALGVAIVSYKDDKSTDIHTQENSFSK
ncbi:MAG: DMT family transporter [Candidatus Heimdallarchaeota archaeon]|nr:DMT family transporter [Candidatus Heimdallarchaeota archaeon]